MLTKICFPDSVLWKDIDYNDSSHDSVDLTLCFTDGFLITFICVTFWIVAIISFIFTNSDLPSIPLSWLIITKKALCIAIFITVVCTLTYSVIKNRSETIPRYNFIYLVFTGLTMVWVMLLMAYHRKRGIQSSGIFIIFWMAFLIYGSIKLRTLILIAEDKNGVPDRMMFSSFVIVYFLSIVQMVLSFVPEKKANSYYTHFINKPSPEESSSFLSLITWWWMNSLMWKGFHSTLTYDDLYDLNMKDRSTYVAPKFQREWNRLVSNAGLNFVNNDIEGSETKGRQPSLVLALSRAYGFDFFVAGIFKLFQDILGFIGPQLLKLMIDYVRDEAEPAWRGYLYAVTIFLLAILRSLLLHQYFNRCYIVGMRIRSGLIQAVYKKALILSNESRQNRATGEIVNLMSVDAQRFQDLMVYLHMIWSGPFQAFLALFFLYLSMGPSIFAGLAVMVILLPVNALVTKYIRRFSVIVMSKKDSRSKMINEILNGIKVIKLYAWEIPFRKLIMGIRDEEIKVLKKASLLNASLSFTWTSATFLVAVATFATYSLINLNSTSIEDRLTPEKAFVALSLFELLSFPISIVPMMILYLIQANVSLKRLSSFLTDEELDLNCVSYTEEPASCGENALSINEGFFSWDAKTPPILLNINLSVETGELVAIVGHVGAGKSSLISALLGQMKKLCGEVSLKGRLSYVPQLAWIQNATIRDNIVFGKKFDDILYNETLQCCALESDLELLAGGDMTEIGEKGINLSGGQKQRVSLARAVYQDSDVYLLDDPLSAVDSHVGKHIFDKVIGPNGMLKGKVRILVTHGIGFLSQCDKIIVMSNGRITEVGSYRQLIEQNGAFAEFLQNYSLPNDVNDNDIEMNENKIVDENKETFKRTKGERKSFIMTEETVETGSVHYAVFLSYAKSCSYFLAFLVGFLYLIVSGGSVGQNLWLAHWSNQEGRDTANNSDLSLNLGVYAGFGFLQTISTVLASFALVFATLKASRTLHNGMLLNILRSPLSFFESTPLGRILNRFSKDIDVVDEAIPIALSEFLFTFSAVVATIIVICYTSPWFILLIVPLSLFYLVVQRFYVKTSRQLKRLESSSRSPIYSHFQESINGASSIRAYSKVDEFQLQSEAHVDHNQTAFYLTSCSNRWLAVRLELVGNLVIFFAALSAALQRNYPEIFGRIDPGLVGLSISYSLMVTQSLNWTVRMMSDLESNIVAVERIKEYTETPNEAPDVIPSCPIPPGWPIQGRVQFSHYSTRYRPGLDLVLKDITCDIPGGQKVGIVGRTGAGKSTLALALFRIIESAQGSISIDGADISTYGLRDLRSNITIIPQDPVLFSGSLRLNLDPFNAKSDEELWRVLETAHLSEFVSGLTEGLYYPVAEGGENLSVGQRQLVCLARALLRKTKILVLDEATAAVDLETDGLIQKTIRSEFANCTILTIAHRINTIMDYDRVMVLDNGRIAEFDSPNMLIAKKESFYELVKNSGIL
ncbi:PREDICTED: multidrug resistance-associated protein 1-like isoform X2 [Amphimedon queenslandica]|uniref:ABC-type glutathione-S-conjugate transporter n=1 Tax=Amphimedon queenslandica TaxID=400682 RepID=A0AAN0JGT3_AMPQE|nr:PREDICTED: multidrug resistance-associated protein 1-like isoform X2 [Amphimedon queenslandica]|eukprot:XP_019855858.1 PREDICTED: multidrug resistance-associated protein 1-like isoform X2 [Amphimedon queenslandica]